MLTLSLAFLTGCSAFIAVHNDPLLHEHTGEWVEKNQFSHYYRYTCGCAATERVEIHIDNDSDLFCDLCGYEINGSFAEPEAVMLHKFEDWILTLTADYVAEIKTTFEYVGVAPGEFRDIRRTTNKKLIAQVIEDYANTSMTPITREETYISGGSAFTIEFVLVDGTVHKLYFNNHNYVYGLHEEEISALCCFRLNSLPMLSGNTDVTTTRGFIAYIGKGMVYDKTTPVCEIPISVLEFVELDSVQDIPSEEKYRVETEFGNLIFVTDSVFYIDYPIIGHTDCYQLAGGTLEEFIAEYTAS